MIKKKLYLVSREVYATSLEKALRTRGVVYDVREAKDDKPQAPIAIGFSKPKKK